MKVIEPPAARIHVPLELSKVNVSPESIVIAPVTFTAPPVRTNVPRLSRLKLPPRFNVPLATLIVPPRLDQLTLLIDIVPPLTCRVPVFEKVPGAIVIVPAVAVMRF